MDRIGAARVVVGGISSAPRETSRLAFVRRLKVDVNKEFSVRLGGLEDISFVDLVVWGMYSSVRHRNAGRGWIPWSV